MDKINSYFSDITLDDEGAYETPAWARKYTGEPEPASFIYDMVCFFMITYSALESS